MMTHFMFLFLLLASPLFSEAPPTETPSPIEIQPALPQLPSEEPAGESKFMQELISMLTTLGFLVAAMFAVAWILKRLLRSRMEQMNTTSLIKILERRYLSPKSSLFLLEVNGKGILVGETVSGISKIAEVPLDQESKPSFREIYEKKEK